MQVYLQVEQGQVAVDGVAYSRRKPVPLHDRAALALYPASACAVLIGTEVFVPPDVVLLCLNAAKPSPGRPPRVFVGEPVARFSTVPPSHKQPEQTRLESFFPENCSLRRLCEPVAGSRAYELQTPEGAVVFTTTIRRPSSTKDK